MGMQQALPTMESFLRVFLPCYWLAYIALAYIIPVYRMRRRHGIDPVGVRHPDPVMQLGERYRDAIFAVVLLMVGGYAVHPPLLLHLGPLELPGASVVRFTGVTLLAAALVLLRLGQIHLGLSWRIGFDPEAQATALVTEGAYRWSRNPIYLGMAASAVGMLLVLPNALTLAAAVLAVVLLQIRVRVEEQWLLATHGDAYRVYCARTPRWLLLRPRLNASAGGPPAHAVRR